ncbi:MAG TPA: 3-oxoacid CoA-transferase subunit A [Rectinemataceae bacterium]|nr:3-oxoacid CoA-transferase subunit A [Rectinemataceae bacterium]
MIEKPVIGADEAAALVKDGMVVHIGGFLGCGSPDRVIAALSRSEVKNLTLVCNDTAVNDQKTGRVTGMASLIPQKKFSRVIVSHIGTNPDTQRLMNSGEMEVILVPQGTLAERIRASGYGLGGILTPTGVGTEIESGKRKIIVGDKIFLLELPLGGDIALIKAKKADKAGNLVYSKTARNFNPIMAMACAIVVAEVEEIVEIGELDPENIQTPSILVHYLVRA